MRGTHYLTKIITTRAIIPTRHATPINIESTERKALIFLDLIRLSKKPATDSPKTQLKNPYITPVQKDLETIQ